MTKSLKFLFWNLNKKDLSTFIVDLVMQEAVDIVILAESDSINHMLLERELTRTYKGPFTSRFKNGHKSLLLDNLSKPVQRANVDKRTSACEYNINGENILIVGVHLRDKYSHDSEDLYQMAGQHRAFIDSYNVKKTIIVGDFNMNPYEKGIMSATGFNAIMSKEDIKYNPVRTFGYSNTSLYYNPSWEAYRFTHPNGSFHYKSNTEASNPYWHLLDQVLLSPELMDSFVNGSIKIIKRIGSTNLLKKSKSRASSYETLIPNKGLYSDHLPIVFKIVF